MFETETDNERWEPVSWNGPKANWRIFTRTWDREKQTARGCWEGVMVCFLGAVDGARDGHVVVPQ